MKDVSRLAAGPGIRIADVGFHPLFCRRHSPRLGLLFREILLFVAEFTQVYANVVGSRIVPSEDAIVADANKAGGTDESPQGHGATAKDTRKETTGTRPPQPGFYGAPSLIGTRRVLEDSERWIGAVLLGFSVIQLVRAPARKAATPR